MPTNLGASVYSVGHGYINFMHYAFFHYLPFSAILNKNLFDI